MADSKSAGRRAVRVRLPLRVQGVPRPGLGGTASLPPVVFWWRGSGLGLECGERALFGCGCCQVPHFSLQDGCCGEGRHVLFHVCGWCRRFVGAAPFGVWLV